MIPQRIGQTTDVEDQPRYVRIGVTDGSRVRLAQVRVVADPGDDPLVRTRVRDGLVRRNEGVRGNALSRAHDGLLWGESRRG